MTTEALLETIPRVVYNHDLSGNFTFINETGERLSGYSREEICRMNLVEIVAPEIAGHICEQVIREATRNVGTVYEIEIIAKGGQRVPLERGRTNWNRRHRRAVSPARAHAPAARHNRSARRIDLR
ncbi:MAG: hypothetical protein DMF71_04550 [Acidobacteria bacterium]|nr:MAG: hypothetical protein DMF71_04550 [Acidobacteriota bacterium]